MSILQNFMIAKNNITLVGICLPKHLLLEQLLAALDRIPDRTTLIKLNNWLLVAQQVVSKNVTLEGLPDTKGRDGKIYTFTPLSTGIQ